MHVFSLQYRQLPVVNCVCRYHGGSPASSDSHQLNIAQLHKICAIIYYWSGSLSSLKLCWLVSCRLYRSMLT